MHFCNQHTNMVNHKRYNDTTHLPASVASRNGVPEPSEHSDEKYGEGDVGEIEAGLSPQSTLNVKDRKVALGVDLAAAVCEHRDPLVEHETLCVECTRAKRIESELHVTVARVHRERNFQVLAVKRKHSEVHLGDEAPVCVCVCVCVCVSLLFANVSGCVHVCTQESGNQDIICQW
jgi:hypothetical protein